MSRNFVGSVAAVVSQFIRHLFSPAETRRRNQRHAASRREAQRRYRFAGFESLETRTVMATDFGAISGLVYQDHTGNGFTLGEQVANATIELYSDNGNNVFNPGAGDVLLQTVSSNASGRYRFDGLVAGDYWVRQNAQTASGISLSQQVSTRINISTTEANGTAGVTIDDFNNSTPQSVSAMFPVGTVMTSSQVYAGSIGGERDLSATITGGVAAEDVSFDSQVGRLRFQSSGLATGLYSAVWDGGDNSSALDATGLGSVDLTSGGTATAFEMNVSADHVNDTARVRVYTDAGNWSESPIFTIPGTGVLTNNIFKFANFTIGAGTGADFTNVGAIELELVANSNGSDGRVSLLRTLGPTTDTADFSNNADLSLTKTVNNGSPTVGQNVTFTVIVSNAGPGNANNVAVTDLLPAGLTFVSAGSGATQGTYNSGTGVWTVGTVNNGASQTLTVIATVTSSTSVMNMAEVTASDNFDPDSTPNNGVVGEDDKASVTVAPQIIDLSILKTADTTTPNLGQPVTFTITVTNSNAVGIANATGVTVTDLLPAGLTFVSATPSGTTTYNNGTGLWTVGNLNAGANATLQVIATVATLGAKINTAQVTAAGQSDIDSTPNNNIGTEDDQASVTITPPQIDLSLTKTVDIAAPNKNQPVTFTITVTNSNAVGIATATGVTVLDLLPAGLTFVSATPSGTTTYVSGTGVWTVGSLAPGANATLSIVANAAASGTLVNTAEVTAATQGDIDSTPNNHVTTEDDQASVTVTPKIADLALAKTVDDSTPDRNQNVTFTLTVTNQTATQGATGVTVSDLLPAGLTFVSATGTGTYVSGTGVWTIGAIAGGGNASIQIVATVTSRNTIINTAQVATEDQFDSDSTPGNSIATEDDQASVTLTPNVADLSVTKVVTNSTPNRNQPVTFTIVVNNAGPASGTGIVLTDLLPAGLTLQGTPTTTQGTYNSGTGVWTVGTIANGGNATLSITALVTGSTQIVNVAEITAADPFDPDSTPGNRSTLPNEDDTASVTLTPQVADVALTKTVSNSAPQVNTNITFTITTINQGTIAITGVQVTDQLPTGLTFVSATASGTTSYNNATGIWNVGTVAVGQSVTLQITVTVTSAASITNTAQVTAMNEFDVDSTPGNNIATEDDQASVTIVSNLLLSPKLCRRRK